MGRCLEMMRALTNSLSLPIHSPASPAKIGSNTLHGAPCTKKTADSAACRVIPDSPVPVEGQTAPASFKQAIMTAEIANKIEMFGEARVMEHAPGIAAHRECLSGFYIVMFVQ